MTADPKLTYLPPREDSGQHNANGKGNTPSPASTTLGGTAYTRSQLADLPPIEPLVTGVMSRRSAVILVGSPGLGKTFLTIGLGLSVAMGVPWLGQEVEQTKVLFIIGEGASGLDLRIAAWEKAWRTPVADDRVEFRVKPGSLAVDTTWHALIAYAREAGHGLVIIDTFSSCAPDADETKDAPRITRHLSDLAAAIDGTSVLVHHPGWGDPTRTRGGSQLEANVDEVLVLGSIGGEGSGAVTLTRKKVKEGPSGDKTFLKLVPFADSAIFQSAAPTDAETPIRVRVLAVLDGYGDVGATGAQLALAIGMGSDTDKSPLYKVLRRLETETAITKRGDRNARYFIAEDG